MHVEWLHRFRQSFVPRVQVSTTNVAGSSMALLAQDFQYCHYFVSINLEMPVKYAYTSTAVNAYQFKQNLMQQLKPMTAILLSLAVQKAGTQETLTERGHP